MFIFSALKSVTHCEYIYERLQLSMPGFFGFES